MTQYRKSFFLVFLISIICIVLFSSTSSEKDEPQVSVTEQAIPKSKRRAILVYPKESNWEFDFIKNELLSNNFNFSDRVFLFEQNSNFDLRPIRDSVHEEENHIQRKSRQNPACSKRKSSDDDDLQENEENDNRLIKVYKKDQEENDQKFPIRFLVIPTTPQFTNLSQILS
jgi:hypothetical protein